MHRVIFSPEAASELQDSYDWYEEMLIGLGERFVQVIDKNLNTIALNPEFFAERKKGLREKVIKDFPFIIVYKVIEEQGVINILHVFHTSRSPKFKYNKP